MSTIEKNDDRKILPAPVQLSLEQVKQIAAGTSSVLALTLAKGPIIICGGLPASQPEQV